MTITILTSREFNQGTERAKKASEKGPVFITDDGRAAYVLLSIEGYRQLTVGCRKITELLAMPEAEGMELESPRFHDVPRPVV